MTKQPEPAKVFYYNDERGTPIARKVFEQGKRPYFEIPFTASPGSWQRKGAKDILLPPYNVDKFKDSNYIFIVESEEQADQYTTGTFIGTCSPLSHWQKHLNKHFQAQNVVIVDDSVESKRVKNLTRNLQDAARELRFGLKTLDLDRILVQSMPLKKEEKKKASIDDYFELFESVLKNPKRCIFNEKLMYSDGDVWNPAVNAIDLIKSAALVENESREAKYSMAHIQPHFFAFEQTKTAELLVDIPEWDGEDRIEAMANLITLKESMSISQVSVQELIKEWCSLVFERLENPMIQNRILVLQGGQGIGKDTWTSMLVDGLGQFSIPLAVMRDDKDTYLNLHRGLVMKISEFDKTARAEVSTLKDIITAPSTNLRAPYDRDARLRLSRCSFISSANAENLLRDSTGNRRFLIFEIDSIEYGYAGWNADKIKHWQMQCLAQMKSLSLERFRASEIAQAEMRRYIEGQTPGDLSVDIEHQFINAVQGGLTFRSEEEILMSDKRLEPIFSELAKRNSVRYYTIKEMLQRRMGKRKKSGQTRYWVLLLPSFYNAEPDSIPTQDEMPF